MDGIGRETTLIGTLLHDFGYIIDHKFAGHGGLDIPTMN
jgi:hypothetical protein